MPGVPPDAINSVKKAFKSMFRRKSKEPPTDSTANGTPASDPSKPSQATSDVPPTTESAPVLPKPESQAPIDFDSGAGRIAADEKLSQSKHTEPPVIPVPSTVTEPPTSDHTHGGNAISSQPPIPATSAATDAEPPKTTAPDVIITPASAENVNSPIKDLPKTPAPPTDPETSTKTDDLSEEKSNTPVTTQKGEAAAPSPTLPTMSATSGPLDDHPPY